MGHQIFFSMTKKMHHALPGDAIHLSELKVGIYKEVISEHAVRNHLDHGFVIIHAPQPLPMVSHDRKSGPWSWHCHVDLTNPNRTSGTPS